MLGCIWSIESNVNLFFPQISSRHPCRNREAWSNLAGPSGAVTCIRDYVLLELHSKAVPLHFSFTYWFWLVLLSKLSFPHRFALSLCLSRKPGEASLSATTCWQLSVPLSCRKPSGTHGIVSYRRPSSCLLPTLTGGWRSQMVACSVRLPPSATSHSCHPKLNMSHTKTRAWDACKEWNHMQQIRSIAFAQILILLLIGVIYQQWLTKRENVGLTSIIKHHRPAAFGKH